MREIVFASTLIACLVACSGSTSGEGLDGPGKQQGLFGGLGSAGASSSSGSPSPSPSSSSSSSSSGAPGAQCQGLSHPNPTCNTCLSQKCCTQFQGCISNADCTGLVQCASNCSGDEMCVQNCLDQYPDGRAPLEAAHGCLTQSCPTECQ